MNTNTSGNRFQSPCRKGGFTLVEILVAIVIIIALAAVIVSVTRNAKLAAAKVADMNNVRSLAGAAMAAGSDNAGRLPQLHSGAKEGNSHYAPYWLANKDYLESNGIFRDGLYAPGNNVFGGAPNYDWWKSYQPQGTPAHYVYFGNDGNSNSDAWFLKGKVTQPTRSEYRGSVSYDEIVRDGTKAFPRTTASDSWYSILWAGLCREYSGQPKVGAIMKNNDWAGVNVMYMDGHTEWVPRKSMKARYTSGSMTLYW